MKFVYISFLIHILSESERNMTPSSLFLFLHKIEGTFQDLSYKNTYNRMISHLGKGDTDDIHRHAPIFFLEACISHHQE